MQKKIILIAVLILGILALGGVLYKRHIANIKTKALENQAEILAGSKTLIKTDEDKALAHSAWLAFQQYVAFAKAHDIKGLESMTYKLSPTCVDPTKTKECNTLMDGLVSVANVFDEKMFTHIMYDEKQLILSSDYKLEENEVVRGYSHAVIYFLRENTSFKIVGFGPTQGRYLAKLPNQTPADLERALLERLQDSDSDGKADYVELCIDPSKGEVCLKTDPNKKDTDGNSYWDGIQIFMK